MRKLDIRAQLAIRNRERASLLERIGTNLKDDDRVCAAWLHGSLSTGDADALSDVDLWVVVRDEATHDFVENRRVYAARPAHPVLVLEAMQNAPPDGAYLLAFYPGEAGPLHVDWFWQPESRAGIPDDVEPLFDRVGLPSVPGVDWRREAHRQPGPPLGADPKRLDLLTHKITFFWAMSLIVAKYIARRNGDGVARMTRVIARTLSEISELLDGAATRRDHDNALRENIEPETSDGQFRVLYALARNATALHRELKEQGATPPLDAVPYIRRFFQLTESVAAKGM